MGELWFSARTLSKVLYGVHDGTQRTTLVRSMIWDDKVLELETRGCTLLVEGITYINFGTHLHYFKD